MITDINLVSIFKKNALIREKESLSVDEDSFGFPARAKNFAKYVQTYDFPLTVGIYGSWGTGKTVFAGFMKDEIGEKNTIWFNAVDYKSSGEKISGYLLKNITRKNHLITWFSVVLFSIIAAVSGFFLFVFYSYLGVFSPAFFALLSFYGLTKLPGSFDLKSIKSTTEIVEQNIKLYLLKKFDHAKKFVFIDNVDRLEPKQALQFLEELKSFFASKNNKFSNYCFVVLCDPQILEKDIQDIYGDKVKPSDYLDKLLEIPFVLPAKSDEQRSEFFKNIFVDSVDEDQIKVIRDTAKDFDLTIRDVKSYLHELGMLFQKAEDEAEKNKFINLIDKFFVLLVLRKKNLDVFEFYESKKISISDKNITDKLNDFINENLSASKLEKVTLKRFLGNFDINRDKGLLESIDPVKRQAFDEFSTILNLACKRLEIEKEDFEFIFNFFAR